MSRKQKVYSDFSGGFNDSVAAISIKDSEVCLSENADYSAEIKSFKTRRGCSKVNQTSFSGNVTDSYNWSIGSKEKKCIVIGSSLYDFDEETQTKTKKIDLTSGAKKIYPFVMYNKMYFGDGTQLYVWGDFDYESSLTSQNITQGQIVKNVSTTSTGVAGGFYQSVTTRSSVNLSTENYTNTSNWTNVTDTPYFASSVVRVMEDKDKSQSEIVKISVTSGANAEGTVTINLNNVNGTASISEGDSVATICTKINAITFTGWTSAIDSNSVVFTRTAKEVTANGYVDAGTTEATITYTTVQEGKANDNNLAPIKKCTMFLVHTSSYRVFATGNPDDNALYYSEIGDATYFKSDINKVYAINGYGKPMGIKQVSDSVLLSLETGWYCWDGITPLSDATWRPLNIPYGTMSNRSIALTPYSFMYLGNDGIYNVSASILNSDLVLVQNKTVIDKISKSKIDNLISSIYDKSKCEAIFYNNVYYLAYNVNEASEYSATQTYAIGDYCTHNKKRYVCTTAILVGEAWNPAKWTLSIPENDKVLKFEWDTQSFTTVTGWLVNSWLSDSRGLYFSSKNYLLLADNTESDIDVDTGEDVPINLKVLTKEYHFGNPLLNKVVNLIGIIFKQPEDANVEISAHVRVIMGYNSVDIDSINISESLVWGRNWGALWGFREAIAKVIELTQDSNTFQLEITNNSLNSPVTLVAIGFIYDETEIITPTILKDEDLLS